MWNFEQLEFFIFLQIDTDGKLLLVNISCPCSLEESSFTTEGKQVTDYVHFSVDVISSPTMTMYESKHDMYGLGILMWELWSQQSAFSHQISENNITTLQKFTDFLKDVNILLV